MMFVSCNSNTTGVTSGTGTTTLPEHLSAPPTFSEDRAARSLDSYVVFCKSLFVLFNHCIVYPSSIYNF